MNELVSKPVLVHKVDPEFPRDGFASKDGTDQYH